MNYLNIDNSILKRLSNPGSNYCIIHKSNELTFIGSYQQPDFASIEIQLVPDKFIIELKSLKLYLYQFREINISYERLLDIVFNHLQEIYQPLSLKIIITTSPRGGFSSTLIKNNK